MKKVYVMNKYPPETNKSATVPTTDNDLITTGKALTNPTPIK